MNRRYRRWVAAAILAAMMPLAAIASICVAHCQADAVPVALAAEPGHEPLGAEPCVGAALCLFAQVVTLPDAPALPRDFLVAGVAPFHLGAAAIPAEPTPPPVPPRLAA